jgi:hypothetical protein
MPRESFRVSPVIVFASFAHRHVQDSCRFAAFSENIARSRRKGARRPEVRIAQVFRIPAFSRRRRGKKRKSGETREAGVASHTLYFWYETDFTIATCDLIAEKNSGLCAIKERRREAKSIRAASS